MQEAGSREVVKVVQSQVGSRVGLRKPVYAGGERNVKGPV
jgi:hypothetical protein